MLKFAPLGILLLSGAAIAAPVSRPAVTIHQFDDLALSPDGARTATVESDDPGNLADEPHGVVTVRDAAGKIVAHYDPCTVCRYSGLTWSPKGDALVFLAADKKASKTTLYRAASGDAQSLTVISGIANTPRFSADGKRIALLATIGARKQTGAIEAGAAQVGEIGASEDEQRIAVLPASGGALKAISPADTYVYEFSWTPDGKGFAATAAKGNGDNNWWIATLNYVDATTGVSRVIAAPKMQMNMPRVSPDGKSVAFIGGLMSDWGSVGGDVYTVALAGGTPVDVTPGYKGTFEGLDWRGSNLAATALIGDKAAAVTIDPAAKAVQVHWSAPVNTSAQTFNGPIAFSADGTIAATVMQDFTHAEEIARGKLPALAPVTRENTKLLASVAVESVRWKNDGFDVQGWLVKPVNVTPGKHPMITIVHGGPSAASRPRYIAGGGQHGTGFDFVGPFVAKGYFVFYPNPRGSYGQGDAFTRANIRDFGRGDLRDILAGIDAVEKTAPVDDARLGLYGHSYGGWMSMWANTQTRRFKAIVAGAGIANWTSYYGQNGIDKWMIPFFGGSVYDDPVVYRDASPIEFIKQAKTPTLAYVGERDVECPAPQSVEYWHALKTIGTPVKLVIYAGEGHHFRKLTDLEDLRTRVVDWFGLYLREKQS
ncbi:MAG: S9 family peptidase [Pseudomonadota bacterium]